MADFLVSYYSRSGTTERLARRLAAKLAADLDAVRPTEDYGGAGGYLKAIWRSLSGRAPPVQHQRSPAGYAMVLIASPVWAGRLSAPMRGYLATCGDRIASVGGFWVSGSGQSYPAVGAEIERLTGQRLRAAAHFSEREVRADAVDDRLDRLVRAVLAD